MRDNDMNNYPRTARRILEKCKVKPRRTVHFDGSHINTGTKSLHRAPIAQRWRMFWRIKSARSVKP